MSKQEYTITMTSKGQFTMPVSLRRELGVSAKGDKLQLIYHANQKQAVLSAPVSFASMHAKAARYLKPGKKPLTDVSGYYNTRHPRI